MAWIEYHTALRDHWKVQRLADTLEVEYTTALGIISCLWLWCVDYAPDGDISRFTDREIRAGCRNTHEKIGKKTLRDCCLIDENGCINDWAKYGIKYLKSMRKRIREYRRRKTLLKRKCNVTVTPTRPDRSYQTDQTNQTGQTRQDQPKIHASEKIKYGEFVVLTTDEYNRLKERFGQDTVDKYIERLDNYIGSKGKQYKSHYRTILMWIDKDTPEIKARPTQAQINSFASMEMSKRREAHEQANI